MICAGIGQVKICKAHFILLKQEDGAWEEGCWGRGVEGCCLKGIHHLMPCLIFVQDLNLIQSLEFLVLVIRSQVCRFKIWLAWPKGQISNNLILSGHNFHCVLYEHFYRSLCGQDAIFMLMVIFSLLIMDRSLQYYFENWRQKHMYESAMVSLTATVARQCHSKGGKLYIFVWFALTYYENNQHVTCMYSM